VDEYSLTVSPVVLGGGKRLFPDDGVLRKLELVRTLPTSTGSVILSYRPLR
jgi:dihydrofolate reductase